MNVKKSLGIILLVLFSSQLFLVSSSNNMKYSSLSAQPLQSSESLEEFNFVTEAVPGVEIVKQNVKRNGGFEEVDSYNGPEYYGYGGSGYAISNASYQDDVHSGSYGYYYSIQGTEQYSSSFYSSRYLSSIPERAYLVQDISLDMWFKNKANPDISNGAIAYMYIAVYSGATTYFLNYYFTSSGPIPGNSSYWAYFDVREPIGSWVNLQRNLTLDFESAFPSVLITSSFYVSFLSFQSVSPGNPIGPLEVLIDDFMISNSTAFNYLWQNGDFEAGDGSFWSSFKEGPSSAYLSNDDFTQGSSSLNLTSIALYDDSDSYVGCFSDLTVASGIHPDTYYPTEPGALTIDFDWKYNDILNGGNNQFAYYYMQLENDTHDVYLYFLLGAYNDKIPYSNYTQPTYIERYYDVPGFGNRNTWEHFSLDLFDLYQSEKWQNINPDSSGWATTAGDEANSTVTLLVDDYLVVANPLGDPSFEQAKYWDPIDPLNSWSSASHTLVNRTTDAHTGTYACNTTSYSGSGNSYCYRNTFLPIDDNLYTDFWWRLDELTGPSEGYSYIYLELDVSKYLYYIIGVTPASTLTNTSNQVYYYVENQNQTGDWYNIFRNVQNDVFEAFGAANWNISQVTLSSFTTGTTTISTIFDDINFVRDVTGPEITNLVITPLEPQYGQMVDVDVEVTDNIEVVAVEFHYKIGAGSWQDVPMTKAGSLYESAIPAANWNTVVQYYVTAYDIYGFETFLGSMGVPFEYTVADFVDPLLDVEAPETTEPILESVIFNISGNDPGSGIAWFEITIDSETVFADTIIPTEYIWDTTSYANGDYMITFALADNAGNIALVELEYTIENPTTPPTTPSTTTTPTGGIGFVILSLVALCGLLSFVILRRRK
jgi:hypothetical protein